MTSTRTSIFSDSFKHSHPIPAASRIGNLIFSGSIHGLLSISDPNPPPLDAQCERMFARVKAVVEAGGGSMDEIIKMTFWVTDRAHRDQINVDWVKYFQMRRHDRHGTRSVVSWMAAC